MPAAQPRTSQTRTTPITAEAMPISRNGPSWVSTTCAMACFTSAGNAANKIPSSANTRPIATTKSDIPKPHQASAPPLQLLSRGGRRVRGRRRLDPRRAGLRTQLPGLAGRIDKIPEELRIGLQHHTRVIVFHARLIGLHRPVEGEEVRILAEGVGEDAVPFGIALAADLLGLGLRLGDNDGDVAIRLGADFLGLLAALRPELGGFALPLGL